LSEFDRYPEEVNAVLFFPVLLIAGLILLRLGLFLLRVRLTATPAEGMDLRPITYFGQIIHFTGRVAILVGGLGPVLAAIGYFTAAALLVYPAILSLALLALLAVLRLVVRDFYALFLGVDET